MVTADDLRRSPLFDRLTESELRRIAARSADVRLVEGQWLIQEGELPSFFVLLEGRLAVMKSLSGADVQINTYEPGDSFGELPLLLGSPAVASLRALRACRVARLDGPDFHELVVQSEALSAAVLRQMSTRVGHLQQVGSEAPPAATVVVGRRHELACHGLRDFLARNGVAYAWWDPDDPQAAEQISAEGIPIDDLPVVVLADGTRLPAPGPRELATAIGLHTTPARSAYDVIVVGGGPAGLAAAVYGASEGLSTLMVERMAPGGQAGTSSRIENYLGFPTGLSGDDLSARARQQAERFGAELVVGRSAAALAPAPSSGGTHTVRLEDGTDLEARTIVLATGVDWRRLDAPGLDRFTGRGVFYGAARTEALSMRGKRVHLVGGGNSAGQAALLFSDYADHVTLLVRGAALAASMSDYLTQQLDAKDNISVLLGTEVVAAAGEASLSTLTVRDRETGAEREVGSDALFVFIGAVADTSWLEGVVQRDDRGFLCAGSAVHGSDWPLTRDPLLLETSVPGVFAAGDVRAGSIKRVASSVGEGSMSIALVHQHLERSQAEGSLTRRR